MKNGLVILLAVILTSCSDTEKLKCQIIENNAKVFIDAKEGLYSVGDTLIIREYFYSAEVELVSIPFNFEGDSYVSNRFFYYKAIVIK